jgi:hypothetical protein
MKTFMSNGAVPKNQDMKLYAYANRGLADEARRPI